MNDGARTHDHRKHNPVLYQLSYAHHKLFMYQKIVRPKGLEPLTYGLAYHYSFHCLKLIQTDHPITFPICGLEFFFSISGGTRIVSTDPGVSFSLLYQRQALIRSGMAKQPPVS